MAGYLKKEFKPRDVKRMRDLIKGKDSSTVKGVGYSKITRDREEGEVWEEDGVKYTIKEGIKRSISKLGDLKSELTIPMFCPTCSNIMNSTHDVTYYKAHRKCFNCVVDFETELRRLGLFEEYYNRISNQGIDNFIQEYKEWVYESINGEFLSITEDGKKENWSGGVNKTKALESLDKTIEYLESLKNSSD